MFVATFSNGCSGREFLMDETDKPMLFESEAQVVVYLEERGATTDDLLNLEIEPVENM